MSSLIRKALRVAAPLSSSFVFSALSVSFSAVSASRAGSALAASGCPPSSARVRGWRQRGRRRHGERHRDQQHRESSHRSYSTAGSSLALISNARSWSVEPRTIQQTRECSSLDRRGTNGDVFNRLLRHFAVTTKWARRFFDHAPSSCPGSNGNFLAVTDRLDTVRRDPQRYQVAWADTARRSPSARLYSAVPRSSQWPSMVTCHDGYFSTLRRSPAARPGRPRRRRSSRARRTRP